MSHWLRAAAIAALIATGCSSEPDTRRRRDGGGEDAPAPRCGDGVINGSDECDDGNTTPGDGCDASCRVEAPTAFRANTLQLISPRIVVDIPFAGCTDLTHEGTEVFGTEVDSINEGLMNGVAMPDAMGRFGNNLVQVFRPLSPVSASTVLDVDSLGRDGCMDGTPKTCGLDAMATVLTTRAGNMPAGGSCFTAIAARVNPSTGGTYAPAVNAVTGPCYVSDETTYPVNVSGTTLTLRHSQIAAQYQGSPPTGLVSGVIVGFLTEADAMSTRLPDDLPEVGGMPFYAVLQAGGAPGSSCNVGDGTAEDDRDPDPDDPSRQGFWFFLNFTAEVVTWTSP